MSTRNFKIIALLQRSPATDHNWISRYNAGLENHLSKAKNTDYKVVLWDEWNLDQIEALILQWKADWIFVGNTYFHSLEELFSLKKRVRIAGHVHTVPNSPFEPYTYQHPDYIGIDKKLSSFDLLFFNSYYQLSQAGNLEATASVVTGFPIEIEKICAKNSGPRNRKLVIFNQRLSVEKQPALLALIASIMAPLGINFELVRGTSENTDGALLTYEKILEQTGVRIQNVRSKQEYYSRLSSAGAVLHTSIFDSFSIGAAEAGVLGVNLVLPRALCYPEIFQKAFYYEPYCINEICASIESALSAPPVFQDLRRFSPDAVFEKYIESMGNF